ncbi:type II secretion system protein GspD [Pseudomonas sp. AOB-7]|uniref:type II secretion system secretin GspD n=1 Tax=Pseudomonas sp. AOB-7 TaxID=2482750 RepID=UPI000EFB36A4|nr:type II secretion system secretin GspD [Pseudomonas sp. AOB-7]RMH82993.1 type II secretion system protein GspD [Pseudomonas sp. AOB-7]
MNPATRFGPWSLATCLLLGACTVVPGGDRATFDRPWAKTPPEQATPRPERQSRLGTPAVKPEVEERFDADGTGGAPRAAASSELYRGSGNLIDLRPALESPPQAEGDITLNFQDIEIAEVVKIILGELLKVNYVLDKNVTGTVSLQTSRPLQRDDLLPTLETMLQLNGAVLVRNHDIYEVVPLDAAPAGALIPRQTPLGQRGYQLLVVPLRYIAAAEMHKILEPLKPTKGLLQVDEARNLLLVAGTQQELNNIRDTVRVFDVDQLRGMSVGLFRMQQVDARVLLGELDAIFGDTANGPLAGMVRFLPIERLNALMVITPQARYLEDANAWIQRLDRAEGAQGSSMFVYQLKNGKAPRLAEVLNALLEGQRQSRPDDEGLSLPVRTPPPAADGETPAAPPLDPSLAALGVEASNLDVGAVSVIADEDNNALLVLATPADYDKLLQVIRKLDVLPLQVLVEATIVEVNLEDELRYGLQWYFKGSIGGKTLRGVLGQLPLTSPTSPAPTGSISLVDAGEARVLLDFLASDSKINVISSPTLMVQDNRTATIRVGDQVPIRTSETTNTSGVVNQPGDPSALVTSTIQYQDTGVLLEVKPRINTGGMIALEITQEVNDVKPTTTSGIDSPTITQRRINTNVSVLSGETLVLGGLIRENNGRDAQGLPYLRNVPVLGWIFGSQGKSMSRTELVVMITPSVVSTLDEAHDVTQEYRDKLKGISLPQDAWQTRPSEL